MKAPSPKLVRCIAIIGAACLTAALPACSLGQRGPNEGASTEKEARRVSPDDPMARPIQVAWTSARASRCGFLFNPDQLRSNYLASEEQAGATPDQMKKIVHAYDYTRETVLATIQDNSSYCDKERTDAIRMDLNRYLAGDYTPAARMAR
jgi:hypothetical protein